MAWLSIHRYEPDKEPTFFAAGDLMRTEWFRLRRSAIVQLSRHIWQGYDLRPASLCITEWSDYLELFREVRKELRNPTQAPRCKVSSPSWASIAIIHSTRLSDTTKPSFLDLVCRMISRRPYSVADLPLGGCRNAHGAGLDPCTAGGEEASL